MQTTNEQIDRDVPIFERPEVKERLERARSALEEIDAQLRRTLQDRPLVAVGVALACGYALARLLTRR